VVESPHNLIHSFWSSYQWHSVPWCCKCQ